MWTTLKSWWALEREIARLRALDDRLLADMGLTRETLRARLHGAPQQTKDGRPDCPPLTARRTAP